MAAAEDNARELGKRQLQVLGNVSNFEPNFGSNIVGNASQADFGEILTSETNNNIKQLLVLAVTDSLKEFVDSCMIFTENRTNVLYILSKLKSKIRGGSAVI